MTPVSRRAVASAPAPPLSKANPLDGRPLPAYDYTRANKLPREMTGYWTKSFDIAGHNAHRKGLHLGRDTHPFLLHSDRGAGRCRRRRLSADVRMAGPDHRLRA